MKKKRFLLLGLLAIILGLGIYGVLIEPYGVEVRDVWIQDDAFKKVLKGLTVIHISDLHIDKIGKREQTVLKIVEETKPDFLFLTGDYVSWNGDYEPALTFLSSLEAKLGVWAVMGDYDYSCSRKSCLFCHEKGTGNPTHRHSVHFLRNSVEQLRFPEGYLSIAAVDEETNRPFFPEAKLPHSCGNNPTLILAHNPLIFDRLKDDRAVLVLAGDTHGGQIALPSWLWRILGYEKCAKYSQGLFRKGSKKMFVTRGVGTSHFPIRILRRPEVVVLHF